MESNMKVIQFPTNIYMKQQLRKQEQAMTQAKYSETEIEEVKEKLHDMIQAEEDWMYDYFRNNRDNCIAEFVECFGYDGLDTYNFKEYTDQALDLVEHDDREKFNTLLDTILERDLERKVLDALEANADLVSYDQWASSDGISLFRSYIGEQWMGLSTEITDLAEKYGIDLNNDNYFSDFCFSNDDDLIIVDNYEGWQMEFNGDIIELLEEVIAND